MNSLESCGPRIGMRKSKSITSSAARCVTKCTGIPSRSTGDICLFWGGLPHQVVDTTENAFFYAFHLPLLNFFRLHLPEDVPQSLMHGATLVMQGDGAADIANFQRWSDYLRSSAVAKRNLAIDELLLRIEGTRFEPFALVRPRAPGLRSVLPADQHAFGNVWRICEYITENFREDIDSTDIANAAELHPKYAMNVFKKSTGMTLNEYIALLRLSYAQSLLMNDETSVLDVAMVSGFRSLSTFNTAFRKISGCSPSDFRRLSRLYGAWPDSHDLPADP
jgi:AraC-like DNA-binding protein